MKRIVFWSCVVVLLLLLLPAWIGHHTAVGALVTGLPLGWISFLKRNLSQLTWNWTLIATAIFCSVILVVLGHLLFRSTAAQTTAGVRRAGWSWRWSLASYGLIWVLFAITFGATGVFRQVRWLGAIDAPWYEPKLNYFIEVRQADGWIQQVILENGAALDATYQSVIFDDKNRRGRELFCELFNLILYADQDAKVQAYVIVPRKPALQGGGFFFVSTPDGSEMEKPLSELKSTVAALDERYPNMHRTPVAPAKEAKAGSR
jgi:hypothetical protein